MIIRVFFLRDNRDKDSVVFEEVENFKDLENRFVKFCVERGIDPNQSYLYHEEVKL